MSEEDTPREEVKKFDAWNSTSEDFNRLLNEQGAAMTAADINYLARELSGAFHIQDLATLQQRYGLDLNETWDGLLGAVLFHAENGAPLFTGPDSELSIEDAVSQLLRAGVNPARMEQDDTMVRGILLGQDPSQVRSQLRESLDQLASNNPKVFASVERMLLGAGLRPAPTIYHTPRETFAEGGLFAPPDPPPTAHPPDPLTALRESSGRDWKRNDEGQVYLNLLSLEDVSKASSALARMGVSQSYGGKGMTAEGEMAVVIPENILNTTPEASIRQAGEAVRNELDSPPAGRVPLRSSSPAPLAKS